MAYLRDGMGRICAKNILDKNAVACQSVDELAVLLDALANLVMGAGLRQEVCEIDS